jgi:hypothetical protein
MPNGIELIIADHERVNELFSRFADSSDSTIVGQVVNLLVDHDSAEQAALYPLAGVVLADAALIARAEAAHSLVKKQIDLLMGLEGPPLVQAFAELRALVAAHVEDEQTNLLPALQGAATPQQLDGLGARILQAKQRVG